jgi:NADH-quinone oxidoreductase subunit C
MEPSALARLVDDAVAPVRLEPAPTADGHATAYLGRDDLLAAMPVLRDRPDLRFAFLAELTAVDFHPREPRFELVYILVSIEHRLRLRLKVRLPGDDARAPTVTGVWPAANWLEREVWDLFGIVFDGHPDPRRLLMPEDWDGFPLRKDYPVQIRMAPRTSEPMQVTEEAFRANLQRDRLTRQP